MTAHLDPRSVRQPDVQHGDVRAQGEDARLSLAGRPGLADDVDVRGSLEQVAQATAHQLMVVEKEGPDLRAISTHLGRRPRRLSAPARATACLPVTGVRPLALRHGPPPPPDPSLARRRERARHSRTGRS